MSYRGTKAVYGSRGARRRYRLTLAQSAGLAIGRVHYITHGDSNLIRTEATSLYGHCYGLQEELTRLGYPCWGGAVQHVGANRGNVGGAAYGMGPQYALGDTVAAGETRSGTRWTAWGELKSFGGTATCDPVTQDSNLDLGVTFLGTQFPVPYLLSAQSGGSSVYGTPSSLAFPVFVRAGTCLGNTNAQYGIHRSHPVGVNNALTASLWADQWDAAFYSVTADTLPWAVAKWGENPATRLGAANWVSGIAASPPAKHFTRQDISVAAGTRNYPIAIWLGVVASGANIQGVTSLPNFLGRCVQFHRPFADLPSGWCVTPHGSFGGFTIKEQTDDWYNSPDLYVQLMLKTYRETLGSTEAERDAGTLVMSFTSWQNEPNNASRNGWGGSNPMNTADGIRDCMIAVVERLRASWAVVGGSTQLVFVFVMGHRHSSDLNDTTPVNYGNLRFGTGSGLGPIVEWVMEQDDVLLLDPASPLMLPISTVVHDGSDTAHISRQGFRDIHTAEQSSLRRAARSNGKRTRVRRRINR